METKPQELMTITEASSWASNYMEAEITESNISYLIQYGRVRKLSNNGRTVIPKEDLFIYYSEKKKQEEKWKAELGEDLNWDLSFDKIPERETTKHVHRLHPYKGKFIPQLVEYFLDSHTDDFKQKVFFSPGDIVLDPFCGSGTTLVQANELGIHAVGIDVSEFNTLISNVKVQNHNLLELKRQLDRISHLLKEYVYKHNWHQFEDELSQLMTNFNNEHFPSPEFKRRVRTEDNFDDKAYAAKKEILFLKEYKKLIERYEFPVLQKADATFLDIWYLYPVRQEIEIVRKVVEEIKYPDIKNIINIILSRTIRTCRATTHADLATLKSPVTKPYYCRKHYKICKPLYSMLSWWERYAKDTLKRLQQFSKLRTNTYQIGLTGDSASIELLSELNDQHPELAKIIGDRKIRGIFSSPPYVGMINYHEQHAYAYDAFDFTRRDELEIGAKSDGKSQKAQRAYINAIATVLRNCVQYLVNNYDIFLIANDDKNLYPSIARKAGMRIENRYKRPVLNRTERGKNRYSEIVFHLKSNDSRKT